MAGGLKGHSVTDLTRALRGLVLPASKVDVVARAEANGAGAGIVAVLRGMADGQYETVADITRSAGIASRRG